LRRIPPQLSTGVVEYAAAGFVQYSALTGRDYSTLHAFEPRGGGMFVADQPVPTSSPVGAVCL